MSKLKSVRGMPDLLPDESHRWRWVEACLEDLLERYGYAEIRTPLMESTALFARGVGETTDIVEKEMYSFLDRNEESLTLRPEGTAGVVRAGIQHGLLSTPQRLFYRGPMFRYERPQKGRYRQFDQIGVECFGLEGPDIDAELLVLCADFWRALGVGDAVRLELNSLGSPAARLAYREALLEYLRPHADALDEDSARRLERNPLRIFDSKVASTQEILQDAPALGDWLDDASREHFDALRRHLDAAGVAHVVNPRIVRGLDYYSRTVFEWTTERLGAQGTVCAGGRYDGLVEQLGGKPTPGIGFALGVERLLLLVEEVASVPVEASADVYLFCLDDRHTGETLALARRLREAMPALRLVQHCGGGKLKARFRGAAQAGAAVVLILGEAELAEGRIGYKPQTEGSEQEALTFEEVVARLGSLDAAAAAREPRR